MRGPGDPEPLRGFYIHIPFCSVKCFYCDFTAFSGQRAAVGRYLRALELEAERAALGLGGRHGRVPTAPERADTLYVGGGTPSELSADELEELLRLVDKFFRPIRELRESTLEANPESLTPEKIEVLARFGVSRVSLGLQTAEERLLKSIGRRHSFDDFLRVYRGCKIRGFSVNVDLMYGLPTQTLGELMGSLNAVLDLEPDHLSLYGLQVEDRTLFARRGVEPDEDLGREMFERSLDRLADAGYRHYEISNFARPGHESAHNRIYWRGGEYVGLGCGASGHLGGVRYSNIERLPDYCGALERGEDPAAERESLTGKEKLGERLMLGLRLLEGVELTDEIRRAFGPELRDLDARGLIETAAGRVRLSREGVFLANEVFREFVVPFRG